MIEDVSITNGDDGANSGYDRVLGFVRDQLLTGRLKVGDRLLAERELATVLGVSRPVIREVLRALAAMGVIEIRQGQRSVVRQPDFSQFAEMFTLMLAQRADAVADIMQARIAIERQALRIACQHATESDFDRMRAALATIEATMDDPLHGGEADFAFHQAIVEAARSPTLLSLYAAISSLLRKSHLQRRQRILMIPKIETFLIDHHRRLLEAIVARDCDRADVLLTQHFEIGGDFQRKADRQALEP